MERAAAGEEGNTSVSLFHFIDERERQRRGGGEDQQEERE
jgi:hypothetical protein